MIVVIYATVLIKDCTLYNFMLIKLPSIGTCRTKCNKLYIMNLEKLMNIKNAEKGSAHICKWSGGVEIFKRIKER